MPLFDKILVANRGEIACRIIRTARRLGIATVAVYSEADARALHVQMADEAVAIGPAPPNESYLVIERIIDACRQTGAQAVHPGYGLLSENSRFCTQLQEAGIVFIGPPAAAIEAMGDKITSKRIAAQAGVRTIPGLDTVVRDQEHAIRLAGEIGYPVMLKASAGGGGKGMRIVYTDAQCREAFELARGEARTSFGDDRLLMEKYIEQPRHIEIQILADGQGTCVFLGERECSVQRRHQKIIEEAPSPAVDTAMRREMGRQAVALARAVGYCSAGTVEFIVDRQGHFYFLEMNTRLQVEHPVTEMITGLDLVEWMIRVAAGGPLPFSQEDIRLQGWALECRIYAEDPVRDFLPATGRLHTCLPPEEEAGRVRLDSGIFQGGEVSRHYDPLLAKLITWGRDRDQALFAMEESLDEFVIRGVQTNLPFLARVMGRSRVRKGELSTDFIATEFGGTFDLSDPSVEEKGLFVVVAGVVHRLYMDRAARISGQLPGHERRVMDDWVVFLGEDYHAVTVKPFQMDRGFRVDLDGNHYGVKTDWSFAQKIFRGTINGRRLAFQVERQGLGYRLHHRGSVVDVLVLTPRAAQLHRLMPCQENEDRSRFLQAPMPGLLVKVSVEEGQRVKAGQELAIIEAMKMENLLRAPFDATVARVICEPGTSLQVDQVILEFS